MREILFRGKRLDNGEWVEGFLVEQEIVEYVNYIVSEVDWEITDNTIDLLCETIDVVNPSTVGQYTGLQDKYGEKILEGDIINIANEKYLVEWDQMLCRYLTGNSYGAKKTLLGLYSTRECSEVIGNIHDNPELLEVQDEN